MTFDDFGMLDGFLVEHPPVDLLAEAFFGYKKPGKAAGTTREAQRSNAQVLQNVPLPRNAKSLEQMPEFLRGPETMAMIDEMKRQQMAG